MEGIRFNRMPELVAFIMMYDMDRNLENLSPEIASLLCTWPQTTVNSERNRTLPSHDQLHVHSHGLRRNIAPVTSWSLTCNDDPLRLHNLPDKTEYIAVMAETQHYEHGRFRVAGGVLPNAITAYRTYGSPNNPCIVFPTCYGAKMKLGSKCLLSIYWEEKALPKPYAFKVRIILSVKERYAT